MKTATNNRVTLDPPAQSAKAPTLQPEELWGVGLIQAEGRAPALAYPISQTDVQADTAWLEDVLERMGVGKGDVGYVSYMNDQTAQYWPLFLASVSLGAPLATGMNLGFDASRLEMFLRRLPVKFTFGLTQELLSGLKACGHDLRTVLARSPILVAHRNAWAEMEAIGLPFWKLLMLGPTMAFEPPSGGGFQFDTREWQVAEDDGHLFISSSPERACRFNHIDTGSAGSLVQVHGEWRVQLRSTQ